MEIHNVICKNPFHRYLIKVDKINSAYKVYINQLVQGFYSVSVSGVKSQSMA